MKTIGLLGGTGWSSTILYYKTINELVNQRLGGYNSAKILLKSINYHEIMSNYGKDHTRTAQLLHDELAELIMLNPDCIIICCNGLHKYYDIIKEYLNSKIPIFHAVDLVTQDIKNKGLQKVLLLATRFTIENGFFAKKLEQSGIEVFIPDKEELCEMQKIYQELMKDNTDNVFKDYFRKLILKHKGLDAVVLGCTEYSLVVSKDNSTLEIIDPVYLQAKHAVDYALIKNPFIQNSVSSH